MTDTDHADILGLTGVDRVTFNASEDVEVITDGKHVGRVFRKGGHVVFRAGSEIWNDPERD